MNIKKSIYLSAAVLFTLGACAPDDHSLNKPDLQSSDLVQGLAYTVDVDAQNTIKKEGIDVVRCVLHIRVVASLCRNL